MAVSTFLVSTVPIPIEPGCGCACPVLCCLCAGAVCLNFTCPDWASWGCSPFGTVIPSGSGVEVTGSLASTGDACGSGSRSYGFQYGDFPSDNYVLGSVSCNVDEETATVSIIARFTCAFSPTGSFQVDYVGNFTATLTPGEGCSTINTTTGTVPASLVFGTPPGSLSPASVTISDGACGVVAAAVPTARKAIPLPCMHLPAEPLAPRDAFALGLSPLRNWRECSQGFGVKGSDGRAYICGCAPWPNGGCGGCTSYNVGASQNSSGLESGLPDSAGEPNGG